MKGAHVSAQDRSGRQGVARWATLVVVLGIVLSGTALAQGTDAERKFRTGSQVTVDANETIPDDLYASAGQIDIAGQVQGDLVAAGGQINVGGGVDDDILAAGGRVVLTGDAGGDVRVAGGNVRLEGSVAEDVLVTGGMVIVAADAQIGGDLMFSGGQMRLDGRVDGDVIGSSGNYSRDGSIGGSEEVTSGSPEPEAGPPSIGDRVLGVVRRYLAILVVGALLLWLAPRLLQAPAARARTSPLPSLGVGFLGVIGYILGVLAIILVAVLLSIVFGLLGFGSLVATLGSGALLVIAVLTFAFALVIAFVGDAIVGLAAGGLLLRSGEGATRVRSLAAMAIGLAVVVILTAIPVIGGILELLVVLIAVGALLLVARRRREPAPAA